MNIKFNEIIVLSCGFVVFNVFFPFLSVYLNSRNSFFFPSYGYDILFYLILIFFLAPLIIIVFINLIFAKNKIDYKKIISFCFILCFLKQLDYHIVNYFLIHGYVILRLLTLVIFSILFFILISRHKEYFYSFNKSIVIIGMLLLTFVIFENLRIIYIKNINYDKVEKENKLANENNINKKIFILTFEKISRNLIHNQAGEIKKEFFTLKKFEKNSNVFLNFNSTSSQTSYSLRSLYSGEYINDFVIQDNKLKNSLFKILNSYGYKIYYLNDIVNYPCRITYVECYKSSNVNESISNKKTIIKKWIYAFSQSYITEYVLWVRKFVPRGKHLLDMDPVSEFEWHELNKNPDFVLANEKNIFFKILNNSKFEKEAYIMHFFITDGYTHGDDINDAKNKNMNNFSNFLDQFYIYLTENNLYDDSLIFISSDTGSDISLKKMDDPYQHNLPYEENSNKIFALVKNFNQKESSKIYEYFSQFDFTKMMKNLMQSNDNYYLFETNKKLKNKLFKFSEFGISEYQIKNNQWQKK